MYKKTAEVDFLDCHVFLTHRNILCQIVYHKACEPAIDDNQGALLTMYY